MPQTNAARHRDWIFAPATLAQDWIFAPATFAQDGGLCKPSFFFNGRVLIDAKVYQIGL